MCNCSIFANTRPLVMVLLAVLCGGPAAAVHARAQDQTFDVLITGGRIYDGTGNPWFYGDVGIRDGRIVAMGRLAGAEATRIIDAAGKVVVPGFIDMHSHADRGLTSDDARRRAAPNLVSQGITTVVVNQDGRSPLPIADQREALERLGTGPNTIMMVGHGAVRGRVMGEDFRRPAHPDEVAQMRQLVRRSLAEGAWGMSAGLEYTPGRWSTTNEVVALVEELVPVGGVYISHERSEGSDPMWYWPSQDDPGPPNLLDAVRETIEIGERTGATVVASHIKAKGKHYWGSSHAAIQLIAAARERGVSVWADQYPYNTTGSDGSTVLIPRWVFGGEQGRRGDARDYASALRRSLEDPGLVAQIEGDIAHEIARRGGAENVVVFDYPDESFIGKNLAELARRRHVSPVRMAIDLQFEGYANRAGGARVRGFSLSEMDIEAYAPLPWVATTTDAGIALPDDGPVHARFYGTYPRKIRRYALERGVISVEDAIRSSTSLPARILGLEDRGMVREGLVADLVVLDLDTVRDRATFFEPHQYAEGVDYVMVGGELLIDEGNFTWALPGKVITRDPT